MASQSILKNATDEQFGLAVPDNLIALFRAMTAPLNTELDDATRTPFHV